MSEKKTSDSYCLGIESTADDFGVGISTFNGEIVANIANAYVPEKGGIHPREAARHHAEVASKVLEEAFLKSGIRPQNLSVIAFSQGPGLGPWHRTSTFHWQELTIARPILKLENSKLERETQ
jgi:tRNA A37 threonylcarbamoyltransferase TsaD